MADIHVTGLQADRFYVYVHSRLNTGKPFYIGKGQRGRCIAESNRNKHWKHIVAKDGGFVTSFLIQDVDDEFAAIAEIEAIDIYKRRRFPLVNLTAGGDGVSGLKHSDESRKKMSEARKGVKLSESHRINSAAARIGKPVSQETRKKLSEANRGQDTMASVKISADLRRGKPLYEQHRKNISLASRGKPAPKRSHPSSRKGKKLSNEITRLRLIESHKGKTSSTETRAKLSASTKAWWARRKAGLSGVGDGK